MIQFEAVNKIFRSGSKSVHAVKDVSLTVNKGEIFGVVGYSGAGKSTLIRLVNLLDRPTSGTVIVNGHDLANISNSVLRQLRSSIGMIFQSFNLFNSRTAYGNIAFPLKLAKRPRQEIKERVQELLEFVGLEDKANHYPEQLSGGQKQRVGIARALATSPEILVCDEATSSLDPETTSEILDLLKQVNEDYNITILLITHEMHVIKTICDRMAVMENGEVIEQGQVYEVFTKPEQNTTKKFVSSVLNDKLSSELLKKLKKTYSEKLYRIMYTSRTSKEPILSQVTKRYNIDFNIVYGSINELQDDLFGSLVIKFSGAKTDIDAALKALKAVVEISEVIDHES